MGGERVHLGEVVADGFRISLAGGLEDGDVGEGVAGVEVVGDVFADGWFDEVDFGSDFAEAVDDGTGVGATGVVPVGDDHDLGLGEGAGVVVAPFAGAVRVAGGGVAEAGQPVGVFLPLDDVHGVAAVDG